MKRLLKFPTDGNVYLCFLLPWVPWLSLQILWLFFYHFCWNSCNVSRIFLTVSAICSSAAAALKNQLTAAALHKQTRPQSSDQPHSVRCIPCKKLVPTNVKVQDGVSVGSASRRNKKHAIFVTHPCQWDTISVLLMDYKPPSDSLLCTVNL